MMGQEPKNFSSFTISSLAISVPMSTCHLLTVCRTVTQLSELTYSPPNPSSPSTSSTQHTNEKDTTLTCCLKGQNHALVGKREPREQRGHISLGGTSGRVLGGDPSMEC